MSEPVSPVCGRAGARLSILTASTGPSAETGSPVNRDPNAGEPAGAGLSGVPLGSPITRATARPMAAAAADAPITIFRRGQLTVPSVRVWQPQYQAFLPLP